MQHIDSFLNIYRQNSKLAIRIISPTFGQLPEEVTGIYGLSHRKPHYFFIFMLDGITSHGVDLRQIEVKSNELLFILPHQIHQLPLRKQGTSYFKLGFDENCLSLLPKQYPFLINPFNNPKLTFTSSAAARLTAVFGILIDLLSEMNTAPELILAHLNSLLTEVNTAYFQNDKIAVDDRLSAYIRFKLFIENNLTGQPTIKDVAQELALNTNSLYNIVKHYSGLSPKEFIPTGSYWKQNAGFTITKVPLSNLLTISVLTTLNTSPVYLRK